MLRGRAIGLQGFERRRGRLFERSVVLLDGGERFADSGSEFAGDLTQGIQDVFFLGRLHLLFIEDVSGAAVLGAQPQRRTGFRGWQSSLPGRRRCRFARRFPGELRSQPRIRRLAHQTQRLLDALVGDEAEEGRLFQAVSPTPGEASRQTPDRPSCW